MDENKKISQNAISAYLLLMISWSFLLIKENKFINNNLVRNHAKSSTILHMFMFINYIVFIHFGFLDIFKIFGVGLNNIIASLFFVFIIIFIIFGIYKAFNFKKFNLGEIIKIEDKVILDIKKNGNFRERDKLTLIISYIPFIGYIIGSKYKNNKEVNSILKFNILITFLIIFIYSLGYKELTNLLILFYLIFISFAGINLFGKNELITFNLPKIFEPKKQITNIKTIIKYLKHYIKGDFKEFKKIEQEIEKKEIEKYNIRKKELGYLKDFKLAKIIIYIPILNLITLFQKENKYKFHIRNGIIITIILLIIFSLIGFGVYKYNTILFMLFPISFGIGNLYQKNYTMPYIYEIYEVLHFIKNLFIKGRKKVNEKRKEIKEINLKVNK